ncbi:alpha/beta hydrolase [Rossellomorea sp. H39__3]
MAYLSEGYHAFILRYSVGEDKGFEDSFRDAEEALAYVRNHASEFGVDPERIAVVGFPPGGIWPLHWEPWARSDREP